MIQKSDFHFCNGLELLHVLGLQISWIIRCLMHIMIRSKNVHDRIFIYHIQLIT